MMRAGANGREITYPQITVTGLGDYSRSRGYANGAVDVVVFMKKSIEGVRMKW